MKPYLVENAPIERIGFKPQMSELEIFGMKAVIEDMVTDEEFVHPVETLGLAYTSSSSYAMLNVCNGQFMHRYDHGQVFEISHFAVLSDGRPVMVCTTNDDDYAYFIIE